MWLQVINKVKVTCQGHTSRSNQGQGQINVFFKQRCSYAGGLYLNQMRSCYKEKSEFGFIFRSASPITWYIIYKQ